jgi:eukaryotic-like serine/threonine-protein kinase
MADPAEQLQRGLADQYRIERELGRGGMATVYLAQDLRHDRPVALKVLHPELAATLGPERFKREIKLAARLQHPHILTVYDSGEAAGLLWYTMAYVEGESLRARLQRETQLPVDEAVRITLEAAQALQYAHDHGAIHRDIKPDNLLLTREGHTFLADFGIGRPLDQVAAGAPITATGVMVGTPAYIAPEQASGHRELDGRADVYSLGVVLYELLAGEPPFTGPTTQAILTRRFTETPRPLHLVRETVPEFVERAVMKALARTPADRFQTAAEFAHALVTPEITTPPQVTAKLSTAVPQRGRRMAGPAISVAILVLASTGLYLWQESRPKAEVTDRMPAKPAASDPAKAAKSVAVLPLVNVGGDPTEEYFSDGMTDELTSALGKIPGLRVAARSSAFTFKGKTADAREVGEKLRVATVLEGSVRRAGQRLRVTAQLVNATDGLALWSETYERELKDVFDVQDDIARSIVRALQLRLGGDDTARLAGPRTESLEAHDLYLRGRFYYIKYTEPDLRRGVVVC